MAQFDLKKLQNGSDIRGVSLPGSDGEQPNLQEQEAALLTKAFLLHLAKKTGKAPCFLTVSVGRDSRLSGQLLTSAVVLAAAPFGVQVLDAGMASTPAMFMSTVFPQFACDGAVMITASHLPFNRNGFKYFDRNGGFDKKDISRIIEFAEEGHAWLDERLFELSAGAQAYGAERQVSPEQIDLMEVYAAHLRELIVEGCGRPSSGAGADGLPDARPLAGLKIAVDAGNGAGGFYAHKVLAPLGADISASQYLEPDGTFPNHMPNPEDAEAMRQISDAVVRSGADFGLIFDTDVDRSAAVDGRGREIARNGIVAMAAALVAEDHPGTTVVTDSITSEQLAEFLTKKLKLHHLRYQRGYKNVINKAIELNKAGTNCQLAIETSGHAALKENYFLDDGAYLATKIVIKAALLAKQGKKLESILADLKEPVEAREVRMKLNCADFKSAGDRILEELKAWAGGGGAADAGLPGSAGMSLVEPNYEGVRIRFAAGHGDGWCLLRKSLHDPLMPLNIESDVAGGNEQIAARLRPFLTRYAELDSTKL